MDCTQIQFQNKMSNKSNVKFIQMREWRELMVENRHYQHYNTKLNF